MPNIKQPSRKKFLLWTTAFLSSVTLFKFLPAKKTKKIDMVKMLTEDGTLVEIDRDKIPGSKRKNITDLQLKDWVKNKPAQN